MSTAPQVQIPLPSAEEAFQPLYILYEQDVVLMAILFKFLETGVFGRDQTPEEIQKAWNTAVSEVRQSFETEAMMYVDEAASRYWEVMATILDLDSYEILEASTSEPIAD